MYGRLETILSSCKKKWSSEIEFENLKIVNELEENLGSSVGVFKRHTEILLEFCLKLQDLKQKAGFEQMRFTLSFYFQFISLVWKFSLVFKVSNTPRILINSKSAFQFSSWKQTEMILKSSHLLKTLGFTNV